MISCEQIAKQAKLIGIKNTDIEIIKKVYNGWKIRQLNKKMCFCMIIELEHYIKNYEISI